METGSSALLAHADQGAPPACVWSISLETCPIHVPIQMLLKHSCANDTVSGEVYWKQEHEWNHRFVLLFPVIRNWESVQEITKVLKMSNAITSMRWFYVKTPITWCYASQDPEDILPPKFATQQ